MKRLRGLCLSLAGLMLMTTPALAADYNFETPAPKDFYGSTSYEEVYGAQYNYGGTNAVDFLDPLADSAPGISINSGSSLEYGINSGSGSIYPDSSGSSYPIQWGDVPTLPATQFTAVSEVERNDGSIGTLVIPSLGIRYKAYDGTPLNGAARRSWPRPKGRPGPSPGQRRPRRRPVLRPLSRQIRRRQPLAKKKPAGRRLLTRSGIRSSGRNTTMDFWTRNWIVSPPSRRTPRPPMAPLT